MKASGIRKPFAQLAILACCALFVSTARADFYLHSWQNPHQSKSGFTVDGRFGIYSSTSNFDANSSPVIPATLGDYSRTQFDLEGAYGLTEDLTGFARLGYASVAIISAAGVKTTNSGFADQSFALNYRVLRASSGLSLDIQAQLDLPGYNNVDAAATGVPFLGDGSTDVTAGGFLNIPFGARAPHHWMATVGAGYTFRSSGFSSAVAWSARIRNRAERKGLFLVSVGVSGLLSMETDNSSIAGRVDGTSGSAMSNAINPSLINVGGELGYHLTPHWALSAHAQTAIGGTNAPRGSFIGAFARYQLGKSPNLDPSAERPAPNRPRLSSPKGQNEYSLSAKIVRVNDRVNLIKIDRGSSSDVQPGQVFDIFSVSASGELQDQIARGRVTQVTDSEAAIEVQQYFKEVWIEEGFVAKRLIQWE